MAHPEFSPPPCPRFIGLPHWPGEIVRDTTVARRRSYVPSSDAQLAHLYWKPARLVLTSGWFVIDINAERFEFNAPYVGDVRSTPDEARQLLFPAAAEVDYRSFATGGGPVFSADAWAYVHPTAARTVPDDGLWYPEVDAGFRLRDTLSGGYTITYGCASNGVGAVHFMQEGATSYTPGFQAYLGEIDFGGVPPVPYPRIVDAELIVSYAPWQFEE